MPPSNLMPPGMIRSSMPGMMGGVGQEFQVKPLDALAIKSIVDAMHADGTLTQLSMKWFKADLTQEQEVIARVRRIANRVAGIEVKMKTLIHP